MGKIAWGKAAVVDDVLYRAIEVDGQPIVNIDIERYLDAILEDSKTGYSNIERAEAIMKDAILETSKILDRKLSYQEFKRALDRSSCN